MAKTVKFLDESKTKALEDAKRKEITDRTRKREQPEPPPTSSDPRTA